MKQGIKIFRSDYMSNLNTYIDDFLYQFETIEILSVDTKVQPNNMVVVTVVYEGEKKIR